MESVERNKRNTSFNIEEIKVRWKKAALENCPGVPCVVTPPAPSFTCGTSTVTDVDGNAYNTKLIGSQCWTTTNLKVTKYNDGSVIGDSTNSTWGTAVIGARTEGKENSASPSSPSVSGYVGTLGYLYNWYAATDPRKLCPDGWHVPTDAEWTIMIKQLDNMAPPSGFSGFGAESTTAGTVMKSDVTNLTAGTGLGWNPSSPGTNTSGFSGLPGGNRQSGGSFNGIRIEAFFWSATEVSNTAWYRALKNSNGNVERNRYTKSYGASVRCLKNSIN